MGNQNVVSKKRQKELMGIARAYIDNGAPGKIMAAECGLSWGMLQHFLGGDCSTRMLELTAKKLKAWLESHSGYMPGDYSRCTKCGEIKPLSEFHRDNARANGRRADCRECVSRRQRDSRKAGSAGKEADMANNCTETAMSAEIVKKVKADDKADVPAEMLAPYFGITPKQLEAVRRGEWDSLLVKVKAPEPATSVQSAVESLRAEVADMHTALNTIAVEMGVKLPERPPEGGKMGA